MEGDQRVHRTDKAGQFQYTDKSHVRLGSREAHCRVCPLVKPSRVSTGPAASGPIIPLLRGKTSSTLKIQLGGGSHWPCLNPMPHCLINAAVLSDPHTMKDFSKRERVASQSDKWPLRL